MNKRTKTIAGIMVVAVVTGNIAMAGTTVKAAAVTNTDKEEVVYIMTDAGGVVDSVNVVNIFGKGDVTDYGNYSAVKMLTSTDAIQQEGDKITFSTDQDKVYYQGTLEHTEIPWNIALTYTLDGKKISPEELAGKTGALNIHIQITENKGSSKDFYDSYALQAAIALDTEQCRNIVADGATLANVGADKQISYTVLPGKGLDAEITADVADFEMNAVSINAIKLNLNVEIDDEELMEKVTEIMDATKKLNEGAADLSDGTEKLENGGSSLNEGAKALYSGAGTLDSGISSLSQGITVVQEGLNTLNSKSSTLTGGSAQVLEALKTIQTSLSNVSVSTEQLKTLTDSSAAIKQGISNLYDGAVALKTGLSYETYKAAMKQNGLDMDQLTAGNTAAISSLSGQISQLQAAVKQLKGIPGYENNEEYKTKVSQLEEQIQSLSNVVTLLSGNNAAIGGMETYINTVSAGADSLVTNLAALKTNYENFDAAIIDMAESLSGMAVNMSSLKSGIGQLVTKYEELDSGIEGYTSGVAEIVAGYSKLVEGVSNLASGSKELLEGSGSLKQGTKELYDGIITLCDGTAELSDGTTEFYEKTSDMDTQVEDSIDQMISSISGEETETVSFASDKNANVESVQFVIKTAAIEKAEDIMAAPAEAEQMTFWQKLLDLFGLN